MFVNGKIDHLMYRTGFQITAMMEPMYEADWANKKKLKSPLRASTPIYVYHLAKQLDQSTTQPF